MAHTHVNKWVTLNVTRHTHTQKKVSFDGDNTFIKLEVLSSPSLRKEKKKK